MNPRQEIRDHVELSVYLLETYALRKDGRIAENLRHEAIDSILLLPLLKLG